MSRKTITLAAVAFTILTAFHAPLPAHAKMLTPAEQVQAFATCAGRFSALAARQNAMHDPEFNKTHKVKTSFEMLLGPICMPLLDRFIRLLKVPPANSW